VAAGIAIGKQANPQEQTEHHTSLAIKGFLGVLHKYPTWALPLSKNHINLANKV
jgi:hypothetical protein